MIDNTEHKLSVFSDDVHLLAAGHAIGDLSDDDYRAVSNLSNSITPEAIQSLFDDFDLCAATALLTMIDRMPTDEMPAALKQSLLKTSANYFRASASSNSISNTAGAIVSNDSSLRDTPTSRKERSTTTRNIREPIAWLALAASLMLIASLTVPNWLKQSTETIAASPDQMRQSLIGQASDLIRAKWSSGKTPLTDSAGKPTSVSGDIVWSSNAQRGYMRFRGLPINDAAKEQYQLWIVDPTRDDEPVDGGVFDSTSLDEIVIPVNAKLAVGSPKLFAITIEKPGGVVVSTQERLPLVASVPISPRSLSEGNE